MSEPYEVDTNSLEFQGLKADNSFGSRFDPPEIIIKEDYSHIGKALCEFQANCPSIEHKNKNPFADYTYADLATIVDTIRPHMHKAGLSFTQIPYFEKNKVGVHTIVIHGESGQTIRCKIDCSLDGNVNKKMTPIQGMGSIITYLKRYSLSSLLGVVTDSDPDGAIPLKERKPQENATPKPVVTWLTQDQFEKSMRSRSVRSVGAVIKKFSTETHKMSDEYRQALTVHGKKLKEANAKKE